MKTMQRIIAFCLALCLTISMLPAWVFALEDVAGETEPAEETEALETTEAVPESVTEETEGSIPTYMDTGTVSAASAGDGWGKWSDYVIDSSVVSYPVEGGCLYFGLESYMTEEEMQSNISLLSADSSITSANIPSQINNLTVTRIATGAFSGCKDLTNIWIPNTVQSIGDNVFYSCGKLENITVEEGGMNYYSDDGVLFFSYDTTIFEIVKYPAAKMGDVYCIPDGITSIASYAFDGISARTLYLPTSITFIDVYAFCANNSLERINYAGSSNQFEQINGYTNCNVAGVYVAMNTPAPNAGNMVTFDYLISGAVNTKNIELHDIDILKNDYAGLIKVKGYVEIAEAIEMFDTIGYSFSLQDTNSDGQQELIVCAETDYGWSNYIVFSCAEDEHIDVWGAIYSWVPITYLGDNSTFCYAMASAPVYQTFGIDENGITQKGAWDDSYQALSWMKETEVLEALEPVTEKATYVTILDEYRQACSMNAEAYFACDVSSAFPHINQLMVDYYHQFNEEMNFVYAYYDIDKNGMQELVVARGSGADANIIGVYAWDTDHAVTLENYAGERRHMEVYTDGTVRISGSESASQSRYGYYRFGEDGASLQKIKEFYIDYDSANVSEVVEEERRYESQFSKVDNWNWRALNGENLPDDQNNWKKAYYDLLVQDRTSGSWGQTEVYEIIYLDDDPIPEIWIFYNQSGNTGRLLSYQDGKVLDFITGRSPVSYVQSNGYFQCSGGTLGTGGCWDKVYLLDGEIKEVASGAYTSSDGSYDNVQYTWDGQAVTQEQYKRNLHQYLYPDITRLTYSADSKTYNYEELLDFLLNNETGSESGLIVFSDYTSMSIAKDSIITLSAGVMLNGERSKNVSGITFQVTDTSVLEVSSTGVEDDFRYVKLKGLKEGRTLVTFSDTKTGFTGTVQVAVYNNEGCAYSLSSVPEKYVEKFPTNIYNVAGIYVDSYSYTVNDDQSATVTFDVYNTNYTYGSVEACDENGHVTHVVLIDKMTNSSTSVKGALWDNLGFIIRDIRDGEMFTYRQESGYSKKTSVEITIPRNGYLKISMDPANSGIVAIVNSADLLMQWSELAGDIEKYSAESSNYARNLAKELVDAKLYAEIIKDGSNLPKKLLQNIHKKVFLSKEWLGNFTDTIAKNLDELDLGKIVSQTAVGFGWSVGQKMFIHFSGPAGVALKAMFAIGKAENVIIQTSDYEQLQNVGSIYIQNQGGGIRASQQVRVESETEFDKNTSLSVFKVTTDSKLLDSIVSAISGGPGAIDEENIYTYNISLVKDGKNIQPDVSVKVYIPIPEELKALAYLGKVKIYRVEEDGTLTEMDVSVEDKCLVFETNHFSLYAIVGFDSGDASHEHIFTDGKCKTCNALGGICGDNVNWVLETDVLRIYGTGSMKNFDLDSLAPWYEYRDSITSVVIEEGVTTIGDAAFTECENIESVSIANSVTYIGFNSFYGCRKITNITISKNVLVISDQAFVFCTSLEAFYVHPENANYMSRDGVLYSKDETVLVRYPEGKKDTRVFTVPKSVTRLERMSFWYSYLTEVKLHDDIEEIGYAAFSASALRKIELPAKLKKIEGLVFQTTALTEICIPSGVEVIEAGAFNQLTTLKRITFEGSAPTFYAECFGNVTAEARYPVNDPTWTESVKQNYGGEITWVPYMQSRNRVVLYTADLEGQKTVWVDGKEYPVEIVGEHCYVDLPDDTSKSLVVYKYHVGDADDIHTQYPVSMKVWKLERYGNDYVARRVEELDNILQYSGSSIRIVGNKGIRMITSITRDNKTALTSADGLVGYKLLEYGTVLCFASELEGGKPLALGQEYARSNYAYKKGVADPVFAYSGDLMQYTNVLVGFSLDQCADDIAMRPYMILEDAEGSQVTIYGGIVYRSIGYIAWQNRMVFSPGSAAYKYVWEIIHHVYGEAYDADYKG